MQWLIAFRRAHPVFRRSDFFQGRPLRGREVKDIVWLKPDGAEMTDEEWDQHFARCLGVYLAGEALTDTDRRGRPLVDDNFLVLFNAHHETIPFTLPALGRDGWHAILDTDSAAAPVAGAVLEPGSAYALTGRSVVVLRQPLAQR